MHATLRLPALVSVLVLAASSGACAAGDPTGARVPAPARHDGGIGFGSGSRSGTSEATTTTAADTGSAAGRGGIGFGSGS